MSLVVFCNTIYLSQKNVYLSLKLSFLIERGFFYGLRKISLLFEKCCVFFSIRKDMYKEKFEKLQLKLNTISEKLNTKTRATSKKSQIILNYLSIKIEIELQNLNKKEIKEQEEIKNITTITYPGFSEKYNENTKNILAGEEAFIYKQSLSSLYEASEIWKIVFYITWTEISNIKNSIQKWNLYLEGMLIDTVWTSKIDIISNTQAKITFDNLDNFVITQNIRQMRLKIQTATIWYQKIWKTITNLHISKVWFDDIKWLSSWKKLNTYTISTEPGDIFSIIPGILKIKVEKTLSSNIPEINIKWLFNNNSIDSSNSSPSIKLNKVELSKLWSSSDNWITYHIYNSDNSGNKVLWTINWNIIEFDMTQLLQRNNTITNSAKWEDYKILISGGNTNTIIVLSLIKSWITYEVLGLNWTSNLNINMKSELILGSKSY